MPPSGQGTYPVQPPPVYSVPPQFAQGPYPAPGYLPMPYYYPPPNPKRSAAGSGCIIMILDGSLALLLILVLFFEAFTAGMFLLFASLVAIIGGALALKGIQPLLAAVGPPLLIIASIWLIAISPFFSFFAVIGIVLAAISMGLIMYGWSDLQERVASRNRMANRYRY